MRRYLPVAIALIVFVALLFPLRDGFTDDGYIHIQYARNIVKHGEYSFNPGVVSFGTTSPLWVMVQAALATVVGTDEGLVHTSRLVSWLAGIAAVVLMFVLARRVGLDAWLAGLCAITFAAHAWFVRWTALSMETSTAVLAIIAVGIASVGALQDQRRALALGFFMALASLLRPECYLLVPVYVGFVLVSRASVHWRCVIATVVMYAALIGPWLLFARLYIGRFLPNTAGAKSGGMIMSPVVFLQKLIPVVKIVVSAEAIPALLILLSIVAFRRNATVFNIKHRFMMMWVAALPLAYVVFDIQVLSRYMLIASPFVVVLGFSALDQITLPWQDRTARKIQAAVATVAVLINVAFYLVVVVPPSRAFAQDLTGVLKNLALFINEDSDDGDVVAAADIGYLAFYSQRQVLDLGGLVDDVTAELREVQDYEEIVEQGSFLALPEYPHVEYFIDRELSPNRFDGRVVNGYRFNSIRVDEIRNLGIRKPGPYFYTLYRLEAVNDE